MNPIARGTGRCLIVAMTLAAGCALAQTWPAKPVRMIVPFAQGGRVGSRRRGWRWGGDGARPPALWHRIQTSLAVALVAVASLFATPSFAQPYPSKPVRMIVPFAAGGPADLYGRYLGQRLQEALGQSFVIDDRPGAGPISFPSRR